MRNHWTAGPATAIGVGIGAAFAASMGPIGLLLGLTGTLATLLALRELGTRRR